MLLGEARDREEQGDQRGRARPERAAHTITQVDRRRAQERAGDEQLGLADDVRHGLDVHRMHGEKRRGDPCGAEW
jgi:hypothetical protein